MKSVHSLRVAALLVAIVIGSSTPLIGAQPDFRFTVHNNTESTIKSLLASEDGENFGYFEIGKGIEPGGSRVLVWDKSTDDSNCEWYFMAVYDDGSQSPAVPFDFCEDELELEFNE